MNIGDLVHENLLYLFKIKHFDLVSAHFIYIVFGGQSDDAVKQVLLQIKQKLEFL